MENSPAHIENGTANSAKFELHHLPAYAAILLQDHLEEFVKELLLQSRQAEMPLLKYFTDFSETQILEMAKVSNTSLLTLLAENRLKDYIDNATADYVQNRLPSIDREEVLAEDITVVSLVRRKAFRNLLHLYTNDNELFINVMEEVDRFTATTEVALFNAYLNVQQEKIKEINEDLAYQKEELLEAQRLAQMGSYFWDMKYGNSSYTPGALSIFGITKPTGIVAFFEYVHPADKEKLRLAIDKALKNDGLFECEYSYIKDNVEKRIWSRGSVSFEEGVPVSMRGTIMDITSEYKLLDRLQQSEALHKQAQALTHIGNWSWNPGSNNITWSDEMYRIHGLEPQSEIIGFDRFMAFTHPDQREKRIFQIQESLRTLKSEDYYLQIVTDAGVQKMLKGKGEIQTGPDGLALMVNGTCQDVTKEYLLNKDLQEKEQNFQQLIKNAPDAVIVIDRDSVITLWNPKTEEIFGFTAEEVIGKHLSGIIIPKRYWEAHGRGMQRFLDTGQSTILNKTLELMACNKKQEEFHISLTISET
ncbi:MAG: PAS domain S-box protein, partial [Gloeobacteraceae cyanobacterium ES-bin-316]|nr:PAS domain S-box protein [Ferruginibacter sp.]